MFMFLSASVYRSFTPQNKHLVWSFNNENDHCIEAIFYLLMFYVGFSTSIVYPLKISIWCRHSTMEMITASRRKFVVCMFLLASVFRSSTPKQKHLVWSFNNENDHSIEPHLFLFVLCLSWHPHK